MNNRRRSLLVFVLVPALIAGMTLPALASHFRASNSSLTYANGALTWTINSAWRKDSPDRVVYQASNVAVTDSGGAAAGGAVVLDPVVSTNDMSNPLYAIVQDTTTIDVNGLLGSAGSYQAYVTRCCRVDGVANTSGTDDFSQAIGFSVSNGVVNLPPVFDNPVLYTLLPVGTASSVSLNYGAVDPEGSAVTYSQMTNTSYPDFGARALQCSSFAGAVLTISASLCAAGDVYSNIYTAGTFFAVKVRATDGLGNHSEVDTLLRVPTVPDPYVDQSSSTQTSAVFDLLLTDPDTSVDSYSVTCTNVSDSTDVHTAQASASPVTVTGLQGATTYSCVDSATNGLGTGTDGTPTIITTDRLAQVITFPAVDDVPLAAATVTLAATADSGLTVSYTSSTPAVCTVAANVVTMLNPGTCSVVAHQAGDATYTAAPDVTRSFTVVPALATPTAQSSTGSGTDPQTVHLAHPTGGAVTLLDAGGAPTARRVIAGQGTYVLDPATGDVTFTAVLGFVGTPTPVTFRVSDSFGQTATNTYTPHVLRPASPPAVPVRSTGPADASQHVQISVPAGGSVLLLDARGRATNRVVVAGQGTYTVDGTGRLTFTPVDGFAGRPTPVTYRVTDAYRQASQSTYAPTVVAVANSATVTTAKLAVARHHHVTVTCRLARGSVQHCAVDLFATIKGHRVKIGHGVATGPAGQGRSLPVSVTLNARGRALEHTPGGHKVSVRAAVRPATGSTTYPASTRSRFVAKTIKNAVVVHFATSSPTLRHGARSILRSLRHRMGHVAAIVCVGHTDNRGTAHADEVLGLKRAAATCAYLTRGRHVTYKIRSAGKSDPTASNKTAAGRRANRRATVTLKY